MLSDLFTVLCYVSFIDVFNSQLEGVSRERADRDSDAEMKERDLPYLPSGKRMSTAFIEQLAYPNPGDSWRSEWTPQVQKYMQHYTADSGRGSQIYGATGNGYGYGGSQIYGQGGGGSQVYGYTGEYPRSHYSRRRSEYDSNF